MSRIPQSFIDEVVERCDIVELIDDRVGLKKSGRNYTACCPFHKEKTPSFSVSPDKQFYYCFGCGAGGNALSFLMDYDRLDFIAAIETLAHKAGLEVPREQLEDPEQHKQQRNLYNTLLASANYYQQQLRQHPSKQQAVDYLKQRGLDGHTAQKFGIGFAPAGWDNLLKHLGNNQDEVKRLIDSGMLIEKDKGGQYDRFRLRIMFPIRDTRGRVIAFGGRVLGDDKPKYLNSPETPVFHKGRELYGLYEARKSNKELKQIIIVEGYMDVVALAQFEVNNAVATLGTATTPQHLEKLFRYTSELIFCFDGDRAGRAAADKALHSALPLMVDGRQIKFLFLPDGDDPDSLVRREGKSGFEQRSRQASSFTEYLFEYCQRDIDTRSIDGKARFAKQAMEKIQQLPKGLFKSLNIEALGEQTGLSAQRLEEFELDSPTPVAPESKPTPSKTAPTAPVPAQPIRREGKKAIKLKGDNRASEQAITLLLNFPQLAQQIPKELLEPLKLSDNAMQQLLLEVQARLLQNPQSSSYNLIGHWLGRDEYDTLMQLMAANINKDEEMALSELLDCLSKVAVRQNQQQNQQTISQLSQQKQTKLSDLSPSEQQEFLRIFEKKGKSKH